MTKEQKNEYLEKESLHSGQFDNLVLDEPSTRVWVSRVENDEDNEPIVTIEQLFSNGWEVVDTL